MFTYHHGFLHIFLNSVLIVIAELKALKTKYGAMADSATPARSIIPRPEEISTRPDRGSPRQISGTHPPLVATSGQTGPVGSFATTSGSSEATGQVPTETQAAIGKRKKPVRNKRNKKSKSRDETGGKDNRQQEVSAQVVSGVTGQLLHPRVEPSSSRPAKDQGQRAGDITVLAETFQSLDVNYPSAASAEGPSSDLGSETPRPTLRQLLAALPGSAGVQLSSTASVSASHPYRDESSSAATPTMTPSSSPRTEVTVGRQIRRGAPTATAPAARTPGSPSPVVVRTGRARRGASLTHAHPTMMRSHNTAAPVGHHRGSEFVSGAHPAMTPGDMTAASAGHTHGGSAPSPTVAFRHGAHQLSPSQRHQASTPAAVLWGTPGDPATSPYYFRGIPSQALGGGAYPTCPTLMTPGPTGVCEDNVAYMRLEPESGKFFWDLTYHLFECALEGCEKRCCLGDCQSVICPYCGPFSHFIWCSKEHMREDVSTHWLYCGQSPLKEPSVETSVTPDIRVGPPAIPCKNGWDSPERHRQAMWFSTARQEGDYFIFADWDDSIAAGFTPGAWEVRCSPRVLRTVRFADPEEKDHFRRILAVCLLKSVEVQPLVEYMYRLLRDKLRLTNLWTPQLDAQVRHQLSLELSVIIEPNIAGQRHACKTEWNGQDPRHCRDPTCVSERRRLLGGLGWAPAFDRLVYIEECNHWILRANRTTHPTVSSVYARTRGEGFEDVLEEERRLFRRGEGWDGAGTGPMEIECLEECQAVP
ncbi:uncharacterized protein N7482_003962 [Penicillium canariense]|uniref:Uncharacterized protein n=1 Tax=Penicillium canariense TaxID=189055 RepID=A0A9W9LQ36_9EURO|nr:uncharacterized protein N7482_003962 [Penicillium canariense]KAJ5168368.1 hypothetical protein N7482_003962 [Penicillium canariense]